ncbi:MAG: protease inhibitor I42 family protein [Spirochaetota bacterium]
MSYGHVLLGHKLSLDQDVGFTNDPRGQRKPTQEVAADTFAADLLGSRRLITRIILRKKWSQNVFKHPHYVYQLSLRLGLSYRATCWALVSNKFITQETGNALSIVEPKTIKLKAIADPKWRKPLTNVWELDELDDGCYLEAAPDDIFLVQLSDKSSSGFQWVIENKDQIELLGKIREESSGKYGTPSVKKLYFRFLEAGNHKIHLLHSRAWNKTRIAEIRFNITTYGKEVAGAPRILRNRLLAAG